MRTISNRTRKALLRELRKRRHLFSASSSSSSSYETLVQRILSSYEKALSFLIKAGWASLQPVGPAAVPNKRVLPTGTNQPKDDGYSWRKYAMEIGDKYPRLQSKLKDQTMTTTMIPQYSTSHT
ncbi:hypothetical protein LguiB_013408 [Lonicera macranthoides]